MAASSLSTWEARARVVEREIRALLLVWRHPRVRWCTRMLAFLVVAYAASPIDLVPDFIPVLGVLDDLLLLPLGVWLVVKTLPPGVMEECRAGAESEKVPVPWTRLGVGLVALAWFGAAVAAWLLGARLLAGD
jgi:uncharacterized membrane protein YkvA (DUF1232 family)